MIYLFITGMYTGYNALNMALSIPENGRVVACEIENAYVDIARPFFKEVTISTIQNSTKQSNKCRELKSGPLHSKSMFNWKASHG